ncbi:Uncharacterized protein dnl_14830 [Desulfonema limicola]|uniref:Uncharacterized protein n=1 Tax=Desulfonema limicola TaxID=45656 RepID=A0A975GFG0_9BACT|nr:hypothetical protein [Desulfonema limicola]QTA79227.1 Uncharacterized protein dnl_14830 [Desulfonema limicola]
MQQIILQANNSQKVIPLLTDIIQGETRRLNHSLELSNKRLMQFESRYKISSEKFMNEWTAEDLQGKDMEYIEWAGEFELAMRLQERISALESIKNVSR